MAAMVTQGKIMLIERDETYLELFGRGTVTKNCILMRWKDLQKLIKTDG